MSSQAASRFPAHVPTGQFGKCSNMCDHPGIDRDESHEAAVKSWQETGTVRTVRGPKGEVARVDPRYQGPALPVANADHIVDVWTMPGGMHAACLHNDMGHAYGFVLAYVDPQVRSLAKHLDLDESIAVDVWHFQQVPGVADDDAARLMMKHLAHAAADGAVPFSPIRPEDRARWQVAVDTMAALVTRATDPAV